MEVAQIPKRTFKNKSCNNRHSNGLRYKEKSYKYFFIQFLLPFSKYVHLTVYFNCRYTIGDLHKSKITAIEWSKNGMRLFSGDKNGVIIMTEIDFYMVSFMGYKARLS